VTNEHATQDQADDVELEDLVRELDAILDAWFMNEIGPALEDASRAREVESTQLGVA
jgi:hypothetical protein